LFFDFDDEDCCFEVVFFLAFRCCFCLGGGLEPAVLVFGAAVLPRLVDRSLVLSGCSLGDASPEISIFGTSVAVLHTVPAVAVVDAVVDAAVDAVVGVGADNTDVISGSADDFDASTLGGRPVDLALIADKALALALDFFFRSFETAEMI